MKRLRLLQVCNVGQILGGTAACAWTVTKSLPDLEHGIHFRSAPTPETRKLFAHCEISFGKFSPDHSLQQFQPDIILLHNIWENYVPDLLPVPTLQYLHSRIRPAPAHLTVCCSNWLSDRLPARPPVLWQAVPKPLLPSQSPATRALRTSLVVGRICTPSSRKWPPTLPAFYQALLNQLPDELKTNLTWEFIGCPRRMESALQDACGGRAAFFPAGWSARSRFWHWDALLYHHPQLAESFGRTVAEAMRAGCIPIVDAKGGFVEQLPPGCGFPAESVDEFAAALIQLKEAKTRRTISRHCQAHADQTFSLQRFGSDLLDWFHRLTKTV